MLGPDSVPWVAAEALVSLARRKLAAGERDGRRGERWNGPLDLKDPGAAQSRNRCHLLNAELAGRLGRSDKVGVFQAYARTAKHHRDNELESARRQALTLWRGSRTRTLAQA